jgi:hypothetical protein
VRVTFTSLPDILPAVGVCSARWHVAQSDGRARTIHGGQELQIGSVCNVAPLFMFVPRMSKKVMESFVRKYVAIFIEPVNEIVLAVARS